MEQRMQQAVPLTRERMKTPRAAAIAGILFSILLTNSHPESGYAYCGKGLQP